MSTVFEAFKEECVLAVGDVAERCEARDIDVVTKVTQGTPYRAIRDYIADKGIDVATIGTHGRTGLERYLIGSVTERTVRTSNVPVLTVRQRS